jgi:bud emergence protein 1
LTQITHSPRTFSSISTQPLPPSTQPPPKRKPKVYYAVVQHDFTAERTDELDARAGDAISVVAQSNREWFVAKPIGKLGRPGLIPVSFVEIRDPATNKPILDVNALLDGEELPRVEDWKQDMMTYKASSIALGVLDDSTNATVVPNSPYGRSPSMLSPTMSPVMPAVAISVSPTPTPMQWPQPVAEEPPSAEPEQAQPSPDSPLSSQAILPDGILLSANVVSFHYEVEEYWFRVHAIFQPYDPSGSTNLPEAKQLVLFRAYNDFYEFQVQLIENYPFEAGRKPPHPRILPFMPGPADHVDDGVTATRQGELDDYLTKLCALGSSTSRHVLEDVFVRKFLAPKPGDVETEIGPRLAEMDALDACHYPPQADEDYGEEIRDTLGNMVISETPDGNVSDGSDYGDDAGAHASQIPHSGSKTMRPVDTNGGVTLRQQAYAQSHQRNGSQTSLPRASTYSRTESRSASPMLSESGSSPKIPDARYNGSGSSHFSTGSSTAATSPQYGSSRASHAGSTRSASSSQTFGNANLNSPPISASNPQTAFVKIKIFDRVTDDLIAIRVHPKVTHDQLMDKVKARLGGEVAALRYRDSRNDDFIEVENDRDLREWMDGTDKHVLYAD